MHDAVLRLDISSEHRGVAVDEHLAARDDEDDGLVVERALLLEVEDLRRVQAVVEEVVLEDLGELGRVREEVAQQRLVELREGVVVGREDREGVALLGRALQRRVGIGRGRRRSDQESASALPGSAAPLACSADTRPAVETAVTSVERLGVACARATMSCLGRAKLAGTTAAMGGEAGRQE